MTTRHPLVVGLDIGTMKCAAVVAEVTETSVNVLGVGRQDSKGLRKGVIINIETTVQSIKQAVEQAELMSGCDIKNVYAGISGGHIKSFNSHGMIALKEPEVGVKDLERVMEAAGAVAIPTDREVLHVLPSEYVVDEQRGVRHPVGMTGVRLEVNCHIITGSTTNIGSSVKCCNDVGVVVEKMVFSPLASALAVLSDEEREVGAVVLDIGGGTSDIAVFHEGALVHSAVLALGGGHITNDIAHGLRIPAHPSAESLKKKYGSALASEADPHEDIPLQDVGFREERWVSRQILCEIVEQRCDEILRLIRAELAESGYMDVAQSGLVITGGCALLPQFDRLAEQVFGAPVRIGTPRGIVGHNELVADPSFACAAGLTLFGARETRSGKRSSGGPGLGKGWENFKSWIKDFF
ncbi:MAG: cell division protein FtsA [Deltaproteobacteria bacterium]|nr:cell division protein FtsA [Deltaproteobacteria bacterium]